MDLTSTKLCTALLKLFVSLANITICVSEFYNSAHLEFNKSLLFCCLSLGGGGGVDSSEASGRTKYITDEICFHLAASPVPHDYAALERHLVHTAKFSSLRVSPDYKQYCQPVILSTLGEWVDFVWLAEGASWILGNLGSMNADRYCCGARNGILMGNNRQC